MMTCEGDIDNDVANKAVEAAPEQFMIKPCNFEELQTEVAAAFLFYQSEFYERDAKKSIAFFDIEIVDDVKADMADGNNSKKRKKNDRAGEDAMLVDTCFSKQCPNNERIMESKLTKRFMSMANIKTKYA